MEGLMTKELAAGAQATKLFKPGVGSHRMDFALKDSKERESRTAGMRDTEVGPPVVLASSEGIAFSNVSPESILNPPTMYCSKRGYPIFFCRQSLA
jgi:hypothetical protein